MRFWPKKLRRKSALTMLLSRLEYEGFEVGHAHDGSGWRPIRDKTGALLGYVDQTACFKPMLETQNTPAMQRIIELVRHLRRQGLAVSLQTGG